MSIVIQQKVVPLKCHRCRHKWNYKGKNKYVATCPHCRTYVTIKKCMKLLNDKGGNSILSSSSSAVTRKGGDHKDG